MTLEQIQQSIDTFDLTKPTQALADAWILANSYQSKFKPTSDEHKLLTEFKSAIDKERKARNHNNTKLHDAKELQINTCKGGGYNA